MDIKLFLELLFQNQISSFFAMDVLVSSLALWIFIYSEGSRLGMKRLWVYVLSNLVVGVSLALPLFLYVRGGYLQPEQEA